MSEEVKPCPVPWCRNEKPPYVAHAPGTQPYQPQLEREWRCVWGFDCCTVGFTEARCDAFICRNPEMKPRKQQSIDGGKTWVDTETSS